MNPKLEGKSFTSLQQYVSHILRGGADINPRGYGYRLLSTSIQIQSILQFKVPSGNDFNVTILPVV